jgi:hypothetical protein
MSTEGEKEFHASAQIVPPCTFELNSVLFGQRQRDECIIITKSTESIETITF